MQVFDINIGLNQARTIDVRASYIYFLNGSAGGADTTISFQPDAGGETVYLKPGQAYKMPLGVNIGTRWTLRNLKGEAPIIGQILMGEGEFTDNRVTGAVEVIDGGKTRTLAGLAAVAYGVQTAAAGLRSNVQLWNPANSGKNIILEQVITVSTIATGFQHVVMSGALSTLGVVVAKRLGVAFPGVAQVRSGTLAGDAGIMLLLINGPTNVSSIFKPNEPIVIPPGLGYGVQAQGVNVDLSVSFEWYEDAI